GAGGVSVDPRRAALAVGPPPPGGVGAPRRAAGQRFRPPAVQVADRDDIGLRQRAENPAVLLGDPSGPDDAHAHRVHAALLLPTLMIKELVVCDPHQILDHRRGGGTGGPVLLWTRIR